MIIKKCFIGFVISVFIVVFPSVISAAGRDVAGLETRIIYLQKFFPDYFLPDAAIRVVDDLKRPTVFGEPDPPEGFAGPDPTGRHPFGIYIPRGADNYFAGDISIEQWIIHEMFHLRNRRAHEYDRFITLAFPDENDPLVQWIKKDPYHRTFAREEAFINLITFADPARTGAQKQAVREWYDQIGAKGRLLEEIRKILRVVRH
jgi:hypothetical protein